MTLTYERGYIELCPVGVSSWTRQTFSVWLLYERLDVSHCLQRPKSLIYRSYLTRSNQVTFGDSDGRWDTPAGSLALGWSVVNPGVTHGRGDGASALTGSNAVVCAAGAGALPGESTAFAEAARKEGILLRAHSAGATATATELNGRGFAAVRAEEIQVCDTLRLQ